MTDAKLAWEITGQAEDFGANAQGQYVQGVRVSFRTAEGATGSVFLPSAEFSVANVRERVESVAGAMRAVSGLHG